MKITKESITTFAQKKSVVVATSSVLSCAAGAVTAHILTKRKMEAKYLQLLNEELDAARQYYAIRYKKDEYADPEVLAAMSTREIIEEEGYAETPDEPVSDTELTKRQLEALKSIQKSEKIDAQETENVFEGSDSDETDWEEEMENRSDERPYILRHDEFMEGHSGYDQTTLTYFEGDDVLADEKDQVVDDVHGTVGEEHLSMFGKGSRDNNVVYIRNDRLQIDFEVLRSRGKYAQEVLGFIEHSDRSNKIRKFRNDD